MKFTKFENKIVGVILKQYRYLFFVAFSFIGVLIRYCGRNFVSNDMSICLIPWFAEISNGGGWKSLGHQVGDYNVLYQTIIALGTYISIDAIFFYKLVSIIGDYALALSCAYIVTKVCKKEILNDNIFYIVYGCILMLPTVILNSSYWGQCDSLYTLFLVWTLYFIYIEKYSLAFIFYGIAFAFKLQSSFLLPFILILYFTERKFSLFNFFYTIFAFWITGLGAYINGRHLLSPFKVYYEQSGIYKLLFLNFQSFWKILCDASYYDVMSGFAILFTIALLGLALFLFLSRNFKIYSFKSYIQCAAWTIWTVIIFLPAMHERYTYVLDILLVLLSIVNARLAAFAFFEIVISLNTYGHYLFGVSNFGQFFSILEIVLWFTFSCVCYFQITQRDSL